VKLIALNVRSAASDLNLNGNSLGARLGLASSTAANYWSGKRPWPAELLPRLAEELRVDVAMLLGKSPLPDPADSKSAQSDRAAARRQPYRTSDERSDLAQVAEIDLRFGMGGSYLEEHAEAEQRTFSRAWLRNFTDSAPEDLFWARGQGNSMEPTMGEGAIVLIDRRQATPHMADLIWAFAFGEIGMIKRLRPMPDGSIKILSDNPAVPLETAHDGELHIIGRVVAVVKKL